MAEQFHYVKTAGGIELTFDEKQRMQRSGLNEFAVLALQSVIVTNAKPGCARLSDAACETDELPGESPCDLEAETDGDDIYLFVCHRAGSDSAVETPCLSPQLPGECTDRLLRTLGLSVNES